MIQINLLPDVKQHFMKAQRTQRLVTTTAFIVTASALALFVLLFLAVNIWQKQRIKDLNSDITRLSDQLKNTPDLDRVLTVQQQLKSLPTLHDQKPAAKRLAGYISQVTPAAVTVAEFKVDFAAHTFDITGQTDKLENVNKFVDTLKFTKYKLTPADQEEKPAFSSVVLKTFGRDNNTASYNITLVFDPIIFDAKSKELVLIVPQNFITTRSETERPAALFETPAETEEFPTEGL
jgi:Tfp pilus assembly protein PilN